jgi:hypothetical protein
MHNADFGQMARDGWHRKKGEHFPGHGYVKQKRADLEISVTNAPRMQVCYTSHQLDNDPPNVRFRIDLPGTTRCVYVQTQKQQRMQEYSAEFSCEKCRHKGAYVS